MTAHHKFPNDITIDEIREAIKDRPEFIEAVKDGYSIFNYVVNFADTFPPVTDRKTAILRELRGLVVYHKPDGGEYIASRRYHKFFNLGEREEVLPEKIDWTKKHWIMDKLDGSMVTPFVHSETGNTSWFSKMGETFVTEQVTAWLQADKDRLMHYELFADWCFVRGITPIFEWCSPHNQIVIRHQESKLILTAMRFNYDGWYETPEYMKEIGNRMGIPVAEFFDPLNNMVEFLASVKASTADQEGIVIRFEDGMMLKVKTDQYCALHRIVDEMSVERHVLKLLLEEKLDDVIGALPEDQKKRIERYSAEIIKELFDVSEDFAQKLMDRKVIFPTKKDYALSEAFKDDPKHLAVFVFKFWDRTEFYSPVDHWREFLLTNCNRNVKLEEAKKLLGIKTKWITE